MAERQLLYSTVMHCAPRKQGIVMVISEACRTVQCSGCCQWSADVFLRVASGVYSMGLIAPNSRHWFTDILRRKVPESEVREWGFARVFH